MLGAETADRSDAPEILSAWRTWGLTGGSDASDLRLLPVARVTRPWPVAEPARAMCRRRHERVPAVACRCGLYAMRGADALRRTRDPAVIGTVSLWGRIVEHEHGFRAEWGYPQRLSLICRLCFWQWGVTNSAPPTVVVRHRGGAMVPLCAEHLELCRRYGYPLRAILDATDVERLLLDTYAVDVLRVA
jgi:hypothetical protein